MGQWRGNLRCREQRSVTGPYVWQPVCSSCHSVTRPLEFSLRRFQLRIRREDIARYQGLEIETISRTLPRSQAQGLLRIRLRDVELLDIEAPKKLIDG